MKKLMKLFGLVAVFMAMPVAFTGGASDGAPGVVVSSLCAEEEGCLFAMGAVCRIGGEAVWNRREAGDEIDN